MGEIVGRLWGDGAEMVGRWCGDGWGDRGETVGRWCGGGAEMVAPVITEEALARLVRLRLLDRDLEGYRVRVRVRVDGLGLGLGT